ncbi:MAG: acetate--CoA ligase family protein [Streptosporangiales bacterium]|nr:acetate--CoA ligase family protein [Streptosporangiales bacterium]
MAEAGTRADTPIGRMLTPRSVAIVGVSARPGSSGRALLRMLRVNDFAGDIHLVGRSGGEIDGLPVLRGIDELPRGVDLALLMTPASGLREAVAACVARGVNAAIAYASGFAEFGERGRAEQAEIERLAREGGMAFNGPNCLGFVNYVLPLTTIFIPGPPTPRLPEGTTNGIAVIAQSGGLMGMIARGLRTRNLPVSYTVSTGNEAGLTLADYLDHFADDPVTGGIVVYAEDIRDPRGFLAAVRKARSRGKSVVLMHAGRSERGQRAAASHTGALAADYGVLSTVLTRAGACVAESLEELLDVAEILARYPEPPVADTAIGTTSGAFCAIGLDALDGLGLSVGELSPPTMEVLGKRFPDYMQPGNPLDFGTIAASDPEMYHDGLAALLSDDAIGSAVLALPFGSPEVVRTMLEQVGKAASAPGQRKPVVMALFGDVTPLPPDLWEYAGSMGIILSNSPERMIRAVAAVTRYGRARARRSAEAIPAQAPAGGKPVLDGAGGALPEWRGKRFLASAGISVPSGDLATSPDEAAGIAARVGYPVAAKIQAASLQHKTEAGGVALGITGEEELREAWARLTGRAAAAGVTEPDGILVEAMAEPGVELMVGARRHPLWGPVVMAGLGGVWVEALGDVRLMPPDLAEEEIVAELGRLRSHRLLEGFRGSPAVDLKAVAGAVAAAGRLMTDYPRITELDINPLVARPDGVTALDALIVCSESPDPDKREKRPAHAQRG